MTTGGPCRRKSPSRIRLPPAPEAKVRENTPTTSYRLLIAANAPESPNAAIAPRSILIGSSKVPYMNANCQRYEDADDESNSFGTRASMDDPIGTLTKLPGPPACAIALPFRSPSRAVLGLHYLR